MSDNKLDKALEALADTQGIAPPLSSELSTAIADMEPAKPRRPWLEWVTFMALSATVGIVAVWITGLRPDLGEQPTLWVVGFSALLIALFGGLSAAALIPAKGQVLGRGRAACVAAVVGGMFATVLFLVTTSRAPSSIYYALSLDNFIAYAPRCVGLGTAVAIIPALLALFLLRRGIPRSPWHTGFAVGAAAGAVGGLIVHLHCHVAEPFHTSFIHGGIVLVAGALGAAVGHRVLRG